MSPQSTLSSQSVQCSRLEVELTSTRSEKSQLQSNLLRLESTLDQTRKELRSVKSLQTSLDEIKNSLEMSSAGQRLRLENTVELLQQENTVLKRKIESESERLKELATSMTETGRDLRSEIKARDEQLDQSKSDLRDREILIDQLKEEVRALQREISERPPNTTETVDMEQLQQSTTTNLELINIKSELESYKSQLEILTTSNAEYKTLSSCLEEQLNLAHDTNTRANQEFIQTLSDKDDTITQLSLKLSGLEKELSFTQSTCDKLKSDYDELKQTLENETAELIRKCSELEARVQQLIQEREKLSTELTLQSRMSGEFQLKYENELEMHSAKSRELKEVKNTIQQLNADLEEKSRDIVKVTEMLTVKEESWKVKENVYSEEMESLKNDYNQLKHLNNDILDKVVNAVSNVGQLQQQSGDSTEAPPNEQWGQVSQFITS
jgi:chromosome segregation ATPase